MQSSTEGISPLSRLEAAFREALGEAFEDEVRAFAEDQGWGVVRLHGSQLFEIWVRENLTARADAAWVLEWIRVTDRKFVAKSLGVAKESLIGLSAAEVGAKLLLAAGFPLVALEGPSDVVKSWSELEEMVENGEDARAATFARQRGERTLKSLLIFYVRTIGLDLFLEILRAPGKIRVPRGLATVLNAEDPAAALKSRLQEDDWADLGFLILAVRKLSTRLEEIGAEVISGRPASILSAGEADSFSKMATALQAYAHDKPTLVASRSNALADAIRGVRIAVEAITGRGCYPDQMLVYEHCKDLVGPLFRGVASEGRIVTVVSDSLPPVGGTVLFVRAVARELSRCVWSPCDWRPLSYT